MPSYLVLGKYTQQGMANFAEAPERIAAAKENISQAGGRMIFFYLTFGEYDFASVVELPDDESAARLSISTSAQGNITTTTGRAFTEDETAALAAAIGG
jgi:uncharacterized protein with GYD domain